jgi:hypothetical protein
VTASLKMRPARRHQSPSLNLTFKGVSHAPTVVGFITCLLSPPSKLSSLVDDAHYHSQPSPRVLVQVRPLDRQLATRIPAPHPYPIMSDGRYSSVPWDRIVSGMANADPEMRTAIGHSIVFIFSDEYYIRGQGLKSSVRASGGSSSGRIHIMRQTGSKADQD